MANRLVIAVALASSICAAACNKRASARSESLATLVGHASLPVAIDQAQQGSVRVVLYGSGDVGDKCPDRDAGKFVAQYAGELSVSSDGSFVASLLPSSVPVTTPSGCRVTELEVHRIETISILAELPSLGLDGTGWLTFQTLTAVDADELQAGNFGELYASLVFRAPPQPTP